MRGAPSARIPPSQNSPEVSRGFGAHRSRRIKAGPLTVSPRHRDNPLLDGKFAPRCAGQVLRCVPRPPSRDDSRAIGVVLAGDPPLKRSARRSTGRPGGFTRNRVCAFRSTQDPDDLLGLPRARDRCSPMYSYAGFAAPSACYGLAAHSSQALFVLTGGVSYGTHSCTLRARLARDCLFPSFGRVIAVSGGDG
jgi:hypothetical protein